MREVETQRRRAKLGQPGEDIAGFESLPTSPSFLADKVPTIALWGGLILTLLGSLYMIEGATFRGCALLILGALCVKVVNES